jgi:predicted nucleotidyltransferase
MPIRGEKLKQIIEVLKEEFKPQRLFLFGSRASVNSRPDSDYDFVLVVNHTSRDKWANFDLARELVLKQCDVSADVWIYTENSFNDWKHEFSSIPETALNTGVEIDLD